MDDESILHCLKFRARWQREQSQVEKAMQEWEAAANPSSSAVITSPAQIGVAATKSVDQVYSEKFPFVDREVEAMIALPRKECACQSVCFVVVPSSQSSATQISSSRKGNCYSVWWIF